MKIIMNPVKISKFLSLVLRHNPQTIGLKLDAQGWADMDELIAGAARAGMRLDRKQIESVVANNDKKRFALSEDGRRIRANQGHSIAVDLNLFPKTPPDILWHGTATRFLASIRQKGLVRGQRQYVHLSPDKNTALRVGQRHGKPVILKIMAGEMARNGHEFFLSENGVWLTDAVPVSCILWDEG